MPSDLVVLFERDLTAGIALSGEGQSSVISVSRRAPFKNENGDSICGALQGRFPRKKQLVLTSEDVDAYTTPLLLGENT